MARLDSFLKLVAEQQASDLHFHAGGVPMIRHDGDLMPLPFRALTELETRRFIMEVLTPDQKAVLEREQQVDFVYALPEVGRFRASVFMQSRGIGSVFRVIRNHIPSLEELRMPPVVVRLAQLRNGLVVVTGPTGAGKSTTLAAMVLPLAAFPKAIELLEMGETRISFKNPNSRSQIMEIAERKEANRRFIAIIPGKR